MPVTGNSVSCALGWIRTGFGQVHDWTAGQEAVELGAIRDCLSSRPLLCVEGQSSLAADLGRSPLKSFR